MIMAACGAPEPKYLVLQFKLERAEMELKLPLDRLKHNDVGLGMGCEAGALPDGSPGAFLTCGESGTFLQCKDHPKEKHQDLSTLKRGFGAWCE